MKLIWIAVGSIIIILILGGYLSLISGLTDLGPILTHFSTSFGKVIGGLVMIVSGVSLTGMLLHYYILKRDKREKSVTKKIKTQ